MRTRWIIAAVCVLAGLVWIGQGTGILKGSGFMVGDITWAVIGAALLVIGLIIGWTALRARSKA
ncbi:MAG: hypothetical protein ACJ77Y_02695 [Chloroflexota bacterium]